MRHRRLEGDHQLGTQLRLLLGESQLLPINPALDLTIEDGHYHGDDACDGSDYGPTHQNFHHGREVGMAGSINRLAASSC
jgi:hypothetical protein